MKILMIVLSVLFLTAADSFAGKNDEKPWDFFGVVFIPGVPSSSNDANIAGMRVGLPVSGGTNKMCGLEVGAACCWTEDVIGLQTAPLFCISKNITGIQASPVNIADDVTGMQFGIVNVSKNATFQLGILNYIKNGAIPYMIIMNWKF